MDPEPGLNFLTDSDIGFTAGLSGLFLLLGITAMLSAAEVVFFSFTTKELDELALKKPFVAELTQKLTATPVKLQHTLTLSRYLTTILLVVLYFLLFANRHFYLYEGLLSNVIKVLVLAFMLLLFGEIFPKVYASRKKLKLASGMVFPLVLVMRLFSPLTYLTGKSSESLSEKTGLRKSAFSVDQLSQALELTSTEDTTKEEQKILEGIVSFGNTDTKQVMSPRIDLFALDIQETFAEIYPKIVEKGYSRIPVYEGNIDNIKGVLFTKDLIPHIHKKDFEWTSLLREPFFVPENKKLDDLLNDFKSMKSHMAIVVDEYGGTSGVVSLEDIIEEIVGDISDEFDEEDLNYTKIDDRNYIFEGKINLKDFFRVIDVDEAVFENHKGEAETLAGFILEVLGNFPKRKQKIQFENCLFTIESVDTKRIKQIKVTLHE